MSQATVERYMSERLVTIGVKNTAQDIARLMDQNDISAVLVTDDKDEIIGIFTERDIVRIIARNIPPDRIIAISPPLVYIDGDAPLEQASEIMIRNQVRHLLVRDTATKEIIGIITNTDLVRYLRNMSLNKEFDSILEAASIEMSNY
jgi:CBS domain-containing protein